MKLQNYLLALIFILSTQLYAHCQIPCGVYDDTMRIKMIEEHTLTILKSMNYIEENQNDLKNQNQVTRWILNKEEHAQEIQKIVSEYFLTQRIKLKDESKKYAKLLGYNYQSSKWYEKSYSHFDESYDENKNLKNKVKKDSKLLDKFKSLFE